MADEGRIAPGQRPAAVGLNDEAEMLANTMWNDAEELAQIIAPDVPIDADPLSDSEMLITLEKVAMILPVTFWDQPDALDDLARLRLAATGREQPNLKNLARLQRTLQKATPDPSIAPGGAEWEAQEKRMSS